MKFLLVILPYCLSITSVAQPKAPLSLGIGVVAVSNPYEIIDSVLVKTIYTDSLFTQPVSEIQIAPFFNKADYGLFHFICIDETKTHRTILVNDSTTAFIKKDEGFNFIPWSELLNGAFLERLSKTNQIRELPNNQSVAISNSCEIDRLRVRKVIQIEQEYWAFIDFAENCEVYFENATSIKQGWVKWRDHNKLLVDILLVD